MFSHRYWSSQKIHCSISCSSGKKANPISLFYTHLKSFILSYVEVFLDYFYVFFIFCMCSMVFYVFCMLLYVYCLVILCFSCCSIMVFKMFSIISMFSIFLYVLNPCFKKFMSQGCELKILSSSFG